MWFASSPDEHEEDSDDDSLLLPVTGRTTRKTIGLAKQQQIVLNELNEHMVQLKLQNAEEVSRLTKLLHLQKEDSLVQQSALYELQQQNNHLLRQNTELVRQ